MVEKISKHAMIPSSHVISIHDVSSIYQVPLILLQQRVPNLILARLKLNKMPPKDIPEWRSLATRLEHGTKGKVRIAVVGKYTGLTDRIYRFRPLRHAAIESDVQLEIDSD